MPAKIQPKTDQEFVDALKALGAEVESDGDTFTLYYTNRHGQYVPITLEAENYSNALFEAYNFVKE